MAATNVSKAEYLKKYLEPDKKKKKKKDPNRLKVKRKNINIIDEDLAFKDQGGKHESSDEEQDKPLVYAADGLSLLQKEESERQQKQAAKWKTLQEEETVPKVSSSKNAEVMSSDSDYSPVRRRKDSSSDYSPVRKRDSGSDYSPPRRRRRHDSDASDDGDSSPDRDKERRGARRLSGRRVGIKEEKTSPVLTKKKSGLQTAEALRQENKERKRLEDKHFRSLDSKVSGKDVKTVYRDKQGKIRDIEQENIVKKEIEEKKKEEDKVFKEWGKGIAQSKQLKERIEGDLHEMAKPLARYQDDKDLDHHLKNQLRSDDPMLAFLSKKSAKVSTKKEKPRYKGPPPPPNRFNIWPGYRWDGVDRSNGFEKKRFLMIANKKSVADEAYKWSVEDM